MIQPAHSVWLVPGARTRDRLAQFVTRFSNRTGTAVFEPHMTLLGDIAGEAERSRDELRRCVTGQGAVMATVTGVGRTDTYFMSLFLDLSLCSDLTPLRRDLARALDMECPPEFRPHISLAYGMAQDQMGAPELSQLAEAFVGMQVDLIKAVIVASGQEIPIENWQPLYEIDLRR